jgi:dTMP kinase
MKPRCFVEGKCVSCFMLITFEGLDFSGKTTQAERLAKKLSTLPLPGESLVRPVRFLREPGGTRISERLREILLDRKNLELDEVAELMLFAASRAQLVRQVILPAQLRGETVLCDRYADSTTAYQGYGRGLDLEAINKINGLATAGVLPDLTILVDISVEEIARRRKLAGASADRMESSGSEFYGKVRAGYLELARQEPGRFRVVNGASPVEAIEQEIWQALELLERRHQ